jgi:hypothetical protein
MRKMTKRRVLRTVAPEYFLDEALFEAEEKRGLPLRLALVALWTCADREGRFGWTPRTLKLQCLPHDQLDFGAVLGALEVSGHVCSYTVRGTKYGYIVNWKHQQVINNRERPSELPAPGHRVDDASATPQVCEADVLMSRAGRVSEKPETPAAREISSEKPSLAELLEEAADGQVKTGMSVAPIEALITQGADLEQDILPTVRDIIATFIATLRNWGDPWLRDEILARKNERLGLGNPSAEPRKGQLAQRTATPASSPDPHAEWDWDELVAGHKAGSFQWPTPRFGPPPGEPGCKAPPEVLREYGY